VLGSAHVLATGRRPRSTLSTSDRIGALSAGRGRGGSLRGRRRSGGRDRCRSSRRGRLAGGGRSYRRDVTRRGARPATISRARRGPLSADSGRRRCGVAIRRALPDPGQTADHHVSSRRSRGGGGGNGRVVRPRATVIAVQVRQAHDAGRGVPEHARQPAAASDQRHGEQAERQHTGAQRRAHSGGELEV